jgi:hypothetical protein
VVTGLIGTAIVSRPIADPAFHIETVLVRRRIDRAASVRRFIDCALDTVRPASAETKKRDAH